MEKTFIIASLIIIIVSIVAIIIIIATKNDKIQKLTKNQRIKPGTVKSTYIWVHADDFVYVNEDDTDPICTIGDLIKCNLPESRFLEITVQFHAADDRGRLRIKTDTGYVWLEPINKKDSYTVPFNLNT